MLMGDKREEWTRGASVQRSSVSPRLAEDGFYRALESVQRRRLLSFLLGETESTIGELAAVLAGWDAAGAETMATPGDHEAITLQLVHVHLPMLDEVGLVDYDSDRGDVRIEPLDDAVADLIQRSVEAEEARASLMS
jgi:DNA-binding transcriptional ArsR family regulator